MIDFMAEREKIIMTFREYMQNVDDTILLKAFEEFQECMDTGVLPSGEARKLWKKYEEIYNTKFSYKDIEKEIYYEMAMRYYGIMSR